MKLKWKSIGFLLAGAVIASIIVAVSVVYDIVTILESVSK